MAIIVVIRIVVAATAIICSIVFWVFHFFMLGLFCVCKFGYFWLFLVVGFLFGVERFICVQGVYRIMSEVVPVRVPKDVARKIKDMVDAGLYSNRSSLVREALRRLVASEGAVVQKSGLGRAVASLASTMIAWNEKGVTDVVLFGSVARGQATFESDVDLLVLVENAEGWVVRQRLYDLIYPIIPALGVDVSLVVMDRRHFISMVGDGDSFALSVVKEGVQLYGGLLNEYDKSAFEEVC